MADAPKKRSSLLEFALIFAIVYLGSQYVMRVFFPQQQSGPQAQQSVVLKAGNVTIGNHPILTIQNHTATGLILPSRCPAPPVDVFSETGGKLTPITSTENAVPCQPIVEVAAVIAPGASVQLGLAPWKYSLFSKAGTYVVKFPASVRLPAGSGGVITAPQATFTISEPGVFTKLFRTFITKPFLNFLILVASLLPDHNLGIAIIILTIVVKMLLYIPTQHMLEGQKKMQLLQPRLDELKKKYPNDAQKVQEETLKLWKEYKINPLQSCLPTLIQFPVLIGLFYVVRDQSTLELSRGLIYPFYQHLTWHFGTNFLGLDLLKPNLYVMPALLVVLQFLQMKLSFAISARKKAKQQKDEKVIDVKSDKAKPASSSMQTQQTMMLYMLPLMIGFFAIQFPAAVSIYWGISTLFGIGQQILVNREHLTVR